MCGCDGMFVIYQLSVSFYQLCKQNTKVCYPAQVDRDLAAGLCGHISALGVCCFLC